MRITTKKLTLGFFVGVLAIAMLVPAIALAAPASSGRANTVVADAHAQMFEQRVINALRLRALRFENYAAMLERSQERLLELCDKVEAAGGDCDAIREQLQLSVRTMEQARVQEQLAANMFKGVPDAGDKRGAFSQARSQARESVRIMKQSRDQLRTAASMLQDMVGDLLDGLGETVSE
ncbi:MAG: hypothetical protein Q7J82_03715 [Coriobacteriia bacterium]|nr:hypothetical protein [Coriobacteriia bacterium]